ncbi:aldo/keto reductase [Scheffersomyces xylosifermentans]|uniref:aldo/keto reductase n=1 Tax=Scheffersomyces xylosifermentans TaxID=1304137 RepID=UPI00315CC426
MVLQDNKDTITLNNGTKIPVIGLGTWQSTGEGEPARNATKVALQNGYRHIDTAAIYGNETEVGQGIKDSGVKREEIFVTTKLWNGDHKISAEALDASLKKLDLDYVDLYLIHWPVSTNNATGKDFEDWDYVDTYKQLQKLYKETKKIKAIGVSNFTKKKLERLLSDPEVDVVPAVNQIEAHPLLPQPELYDYLKEKNIVIESYSPLGSTDAPLFKNETVAAIAKKNNVEPGHVLISWAVQRNTVVLPKSVTDARIISNLKTFKLPEEDFEALNNLSKTDGVKRWANPPWNNFDD